METTAPVSNLKRVSLSFTLTTAVQKSPLLLKNSPRKDVDVFKICYFVHGLSLHRLLRKTNSVKGTLFILVCAAVDHTTLIFARTLIGCRSPLLIFLSGLCFSNEEWSLSSALLLPTDDSCVLRARRLTPPSLEDDLTACHQELPQQCDHGRGRLSENRTHSLLPVCINLEWRHPPVSSVNTGSLYYQIAANIEISSFVFVDSESG